MKKTFLYFSVSVALFIMLFHTTDVGINAFLYAVATILLSLGLKPKLNLERGMVMLFFFVAAACVAYYADAFSIMMTFVLYVLMGVYQANPKESIIMAPVQGFLSGFLSFFHFISLLSSFAIPSKTNRLLKGLALFIIPIVLVGLFIFIYTNVNLQFEAVMMKVAMPELDEFFVFICCLSIFLNFSYWYFKTWINPKFYQEFTSDFIAAPKLSKEEIETATIWVQSGCVVFVLLNLILLLLLGFEFSEVFQQRTSDYTANFSQQVHLSVSSVIFSIVIGISLILIYTRKELLFIKKSPTLKKWIYLWIALNVVLLITTALKNDFYVMNLGLTLKRLGVYGFLTLAFLGLILTFYKIKETLSSYFLIQTMAWTMITFATFICPVNWSNFITRYNVENQVEGRPIDTSYLIYHLDYNHLMLLKNSASFSKDDRKKVRNRVLTKEHQSILSRSIYEMEVTRYLKSMQ